MGTLSIVTTVPPFWGPKLGDNDTTPPSSQLSPSDDVGEVTGKRLTPDVDGSTEREGIPVGMMLGWLLGKLLGIEDGPTERDGWPVGNKLGRYDKLGRQVGTNDGSFDMLGLEVDTKGSVGLEVVGPTEGDVVG